MLCEVCPEPVAASDPVLICTICPLLNIVGAICHYLLTKKPVSNAERENYESFATRVHARLGDSGRVRRCCSRSQVMANALRVGHLEVLSCLHSITITV